jgi:hypothetical protein
MPTRNQPASFGILRTQKVLGYLPGLRVPRWKNLLQLNEFTAATC